MKEIRKEKVGGTGKGRSESSRGLGRSTLVALVAGLARLVRPLVDTVVVTSAVLAPRAIGRAAERLAVLRAVGLGDGLGVGDWVGLGDGRDVGS